MAQQIQEKKTYFYFYYSISTTTGFLRDARIFLIEKHPEQSVVKINNLNISTQALKRASYLGNPVEPKQCNLNSFILTKVEIVLTKNILWPANNNFYRASCFQTGGNALIMSHLQLRVRFM